MDTVILVTAITAGWVLAGLGWFAFWAANSALRDVVWQRNQIATQLITENPGHRAWVLGITDTRGQE